MLCFENTAGGIDRRFRLQVILAMVQVSHGTFQGLSAPAFKSSFECNAAVIAGVLQSREVP